MKEAVRLAARWEIPFPVYLICVSVIVLAIAAQTWWSIAQDRYLTITAAQDTSLQAVRLLEEHASRIVQYINADMGAAIEELKHHPDAIWRDEKTMRQILVTERQDSQYLQALSVLDTHGTLWVTSYQYPAIRRDLSERPHIRYLLEHPDEKSEIIGTAIHLDNIRLAQLPMARNMFDASGERIGIMQADISLDYFSDFYERVAKDGQAMVSIFNQEGTLLLHAPADERYLNLSFEHSQLFKRIHDGSLEGVLQDNSWITPDASALYAYRKLGEFPMTVVYAKNLDTILNAWKTRTLQRLVFAGITLFFILFLIAILGWNFRRLKKSTRKLSASENRHRLLFEGSHDSIFLIDKEYRYVDCNIAACQLFGIANSKEIIGKRVGEFSVRVQSVAELPEVDSYVLIHKLVDRTFAGETPRFEWVTHRNGELLYSEITLTCVESESEMLVFCVMRDINARKYTERLLKGQNRLLHMVGGSEELSFILESICDFVEKMMPQWCCSIQLISENQHRFSLVTGNKLSVALKEQIRNQEIAHGNGIWSEAILSATPVRLEQGQSHDMSLYLMNEPELSRYRSYGAWPILGKNGQLLGAMALFFPTTEALSDDSQHLITITTDIASIAIEDRRAEDRILKLAHYDELTGLPNRFLYGQHLSKALAYAERNRTQLAVLFLDLDRFKNINDTFGHDEGDAVLRAIAARFKQCLRESDIVARVGGDEFILLIEHFNSSKDLVDISKKLLAAACQPFEIHGQECHLSASIGIATYPSDGRDDQTLLKNADIAMYRAKNKGKDTYQFYASEMNVHTVERLAFEARLRKALERREFVVYYQPKVSVETGRIIGAEALVRWNHPERGILPPGEFITLAEEAGLVGKLGMQVLDIACRDILAFRKIDSQFGRVAINLSGAQFNDANLLADVKSVVDFWRVPSHHIEFEITESMVMHNRDQAIVLMDGFKTAGFTLSIDDFGTGYSSLAYLKRFPVDSVKVDRSFIKDIPDDPNDTAIVLAIVAMAHTLGMKVVAEGVETTSQLDTLHASGCDAYQGYLFGKPVNDTDFARLLLKNSTKKQVA